MTETGANEFVATDWERLQELLHRNSWNESISRYRSPYVFRGNSNADYALETSISRFVGDSGRWELEGNLLRNFLKYARRDLAVPESPYYRMAIAQHHGLPTRLLDWTYSPAVAAYFASRGREDVDGIVWAVDYAAVHERLPPFLRQFLDRANANMFDADLLDDATKQLTREYLDASERPRETAVVHLYDVRDAITEFAESQPDDYVLFFEPPSIDQRIVNQASLFSSQSNPRLAMDEWLSEHPDLYYTIVVPAERKGEFRDKLDQMNVNQRTLFPGLDGIASWLTEYYAPGTSEAA